MKKLQCHRCGNDKFLAISNNPEIPCPCCGCQYGGIVMSIPTITPERLLTPIDIDKVDTLDFTCAKIIAYYIAKGLSVSKVARQLGLTRATIYKKLRKYKMLQTKPNTPFRLNIQATDAFASGQTFKPNLGAKKCT